MQVSEEIQKFQKRPILVNFITAINTLSLIITGHWLSNLGAAEIRAHLHFYAPGLLAMMCALAGLAPFWQWRGLGWMALFLFNLLMALQSLTWLFGSSSNLRTVWTALGIMALHIFTLFLLVHPKVLDLYSNPHARVWIRAKRFTLNRPALMNFNGNRAEGTLIDLSATGCSFALPTRIPMNEVVAIFASEHGKASYRVEVIRQIGRTADQKFVYGARFLTKLSHAALRDFLEGQHQPDQKDA